MKKRCPICQEMAYAVSVAEIREIAVKGMTTKTKGNRICIDSNQLIEKNGKITVYKHK